MNQRVFVGNVFFNVVFSLPFSLKNIEYDNRRQTKYRRFFLLESEEKETEISRRKNGRV